ncbi:MAG TPA: 4-aminobutyrate--2-oxoglutarate transaminase [Thermodesulfobacteriota bacterium]|nr:4-aminobutyrate--2-oxoglutarate transaminase [Thermodesulfobacteriota bacterium]
MIREDLVKKRQEHVARGVNQFIPAMVAEAKGVIVRDVEGREFLDFSGGIGVLNVGHCPDEVVEAIRDQAGKYLHTCFMVQMYEPYIELAKQLNELVSRKSPMKTMFVNSGAEAVENAVKIAKYYTKRPGILCFENAFHGRTAMTMSLTSKVKNYKFGFWPFMSEVYRAPYAYCYRCSYGLKYPSCGIYCADFIQEKFFDLYAAAESIAAVIVEPVQGEGGFIVPPREYLGKLQKICNDNGIVFIVDEVQTGFGRTGKMFAFENFGVEPDIVVTAKSLAAGLPLGGVTGKAEIMDSVDNAGIGGTFGGNPVCCRAGLAVLKLMKERNLVERSNAIGKQVMARMNAFKEKYAFVGDVRGLGGMNAMEIVKDKKNPKPNGDLAKAIVKRCYEKGLIMLTAGGYGNVIRSLVPLVVTDEELAKGLRILDEAMAEKAE